MHRCEHARSGLESFRDVGIAQTLKRELMHMTGRRLQAEKEGPLLNMEQSCERERRTDLPLHSAAP